ncbi:MAG: EAL domain-containing protein [Polyangiaceae bacterium]
MSIQQVEQTSPRSGFGTVLIVDDDASVRRDYARLLRRLDIEVRTASDGEEALKNFSAGSCDTILTDIAMPSLGGLEFLRVIRAIDLDVPVVLMTGKPSFETAVKAIEYGASGYLVKPVEPSALENAIWRSIYLHRLAKLRREAAQSNADSLQLGDRAGLDARFGSALDLLWMSFQPIVDYRKQRVLGYEALVRSEEPSLRGPSGLFDAAERLDWVPHLTRVILTRTTSVFVNAPDDVLLFLNLNASELNNDLLLSEEGPLRPFASRTVLEVTERAALDRTHGLTARLAQLRKLGLRIAVDDLGAGYAGLSSFSMLEPEFVKLDMSLIRGIDSSPSKRALVRGIGQICMRDLGISVICEGVEHAEERDTLLENGLELLQGYLFGRPVKGFEIPTW